MQSSYFVLTLKSVPTKVEDLLTEFCFSFGAQGISEVLQFRQESQKYEPETVATPHHDLEVYFTEKPEESFFSELRLRFPEIEAEIRQEEEKDWLEEWKKGYEPFCLAKGLWVVPSWREKPKEAQAELRIDPGMAFGTGTHATTRLAAGLLSDLPLNRARVLDVGTGTGILAMAACQWGAGSLVGTEIDPQAREVARENIERNQMSAQISIPEFQVESVDGEFDVVIANIIDGVLVEIQDALMTKTKKGGHLLLTGILQEREADFRREFKWETSGFELLERRVDEEWVGLLLKRTGL
ncbi:MAG: 50S ribosomal protein L11 methyltransferase [Bdellovibrionaceae bacterium]|nr:50S ribosomal protein L11 methyltransferase [Pseudobdellovibrionaceae bacterium]